MECQLYGTFHRDDAEAFKFIETRLQWLWLRQFGGRMREVLSR